MRNTKLYKCLLCICLGMLCWQAPAQQLSSEQAEINTVLREIEYLREHVMQMQRKYAGNKGAKIRFNYLALIEQLTATENGIRAYLNAQIDAIHLTPPKPLERSLHDVRRN